MSESKSKLMLADLSGFSVDSKHSFLEKVVEYYDYYCATRSPPILDHYWIYFGY